MSQFIGARQASLLFGLSIALVSFQNCGKVQFNGDSSTPTLTTKTDGAVSSGTSSSSSSSTGSSGSTIANSGSSSGHDSQGDCDHSGDSSNRDGSDASSDDESDSKSGLVACIVDGDGESRRIAVDSNQSLSAKTGTPSDVCMSEHACLDVVSREFPVSGAEHRGYCNGQDPHVVEMSDSQIKNLVDKDLSGHR